MPTKIHLPIAAALANELGPKGACVVAAALAFVGTVIGGLAFVDCVVDSHVYHSLIESAFFDGGHKNKAFDADLAHARWHMSLRASDVRKMGRNIDGYEKSLLEGLMKDLRDIIYINEDQERARAIGGFSTLVNAHNADIKRTVNELRDIRNSGLEGVAVEFADIDLSIDRLKKASDVLGVAAAELAAEPDRVTLHGIQQQFEGVLSSFETRPDRSEATATTAK